MKGMVRAIATMFATLVLASLLAVSAGAQCGASDGPLTSNTATALLMHSDGTENLNSSRPPATSNFCLGVWEKTGASTYKLNHFALSSDLSGNMIGPANIREDVTLDAHGTGYTGIFSIDQYDTSGNLLVHIVGEVKATRITVDTKLSDIL
jgi:hypothetical protein